MPDQYSLPGFEPKRERDFLFFALLLDDDDTSRIARLREQLCSDCRLHTPLIARHLLHISLHGIGEFDGLPPAAVERAREAAALVSMSRFEVRFDRAMSFERHQDTRPFVLRTARGSMEVMRFHRVLGDAMKCVGFCRVRSDFSPHMTLLYDRRFVQERAIETVRINAQRFVLVHSLRGRGHSAYVHLACWPLRG